jgi:hypothetical protein
LGCDVFANGDEIACKAGAGKVIAAFPDVCLTPPPPPAGPIPVPYPDTSFSKDMKEGSKTVLIGGQEVMLKDQSFYKTSPLGNEPATKGQGAGVASHVITGTTYFVAWSMDVKFEDQNVDRHTDLTTSNHNPMENVFAPMPNWASTKPGRPQLYPNQTCRDEVRDKIHKKQKEHEAQLSSADNCNPNANARSLAAQALIPCARLRQRRRVQRRVLAARQEMQAKCFSDPSLDPPPPAPPRKSQRVTHQEAIEATKQDLINIKDRMKKNNCR